MLSRGLVYGFFIQDPADRRCGEEGRTKRFIRRERIGNFEDTGFGPLAIQSSRLVFVQALVQLPRCGVALPGCDQNLKLINNLEGLLNRFPCTLEVVLGHRDSGLQIPSERLQVRIGRGQRGLKKTVGRSAGPREVSRHKPGIDRFKLCHQSPPPMPKKLSAYRRLEYVFEMFYGLTVFPSMKCYVSGGHLVNSLALRVRILSSHLA